MIWFLLAAAVSLGAFDWAGAGGSRRYWLTVSVALTAFGLALALQFPQGATECLPGSGAGCRAGFVLLLGLFLLSTAVLGAGSMFRRLSVPSFVALTLSDLCLLLAVWEYHREAALWALPGRGGWGAASAWGAAAALLRLGAPLLASVPAGSRSQKPREGGPLRSLFHRSGVVGGRAGLAQAGLSCVGWWQGAFLAWWVGPPGAVWLVLGGLVLWPAAAMLARSAPGALSVAGGLVAVAAALPVPAAGLAGMGLAGVALALAEPLIGIWAMAALPLSLLTTTPLPSPISASSVLADDASLVAFPAVLFACTLLVSAVWPAVAAGLRLPRTAATHAEAAPLSRPSALLASAAAAGAVFAGSLRLDWLAWAAAGAGLAALASRFLVQDMPVTTGKDEAGTESGPAAPRWPGKHAEEPQGEVAAAGKEQIVRPSAEDGLLKAFARGAPGWALLLLAAALFGWLVSVGLQTEFL